MASWFTRALDRVTPWNRGGEVQRRIERKRKEEEERVANVPKLRVQNAQPTQNVVLDQPLKVQQPPPNIFETLNKNLVFNKPQTVIPVLPTPDTQPPPLPKPGLVVKPTVQPPQINRVMTAPDRGVRVGDAPVVRRDPNARVERADPNIVAKNTSNLRKVVSTPVLSTARVGTGLIQGAGGLFDLLTPGKGQNRVTQTMNEQAETIDEQAKQMGVNKAYKTLNVPAEILTYFAGAPTKAGNATKVGRIPNLIEKINEFIGGSTRGRRIITQAAEELLNPENLAQEARLTGRYTGQDSAHGKDIDAKYVAENALMSLGGAFAPAILRNLRRVPGAEVRRGVDEAASGLGATTRIDDLLSDADVQDILRRDIPVKTNVPVNQIPTETNIPVRNTTPQGPIIRELGGDATQVTVPRTPAEVAEQQATDRFTNQNFGTPDDRIEGVTPRSPEAPFRLEENASQNAQNKLVDEYADFLRSVGEGNGVAITPDGRRVSNNVRFGDTGGKRMTKADWRDEAERQLRTGQADPSIQKAFDESVNPEVQALVNQPEPTDVPVGRPITVKAVNSIPVNDQTVVAQNLPETPGTVRVTEATAPSNAKSVAVASQNPVVLPKEVQDVLDNPKKFTKREVAAARNQAKLAKQKAKADEQTVAAMQRIEASKTNPGAGQPEGFAPTGEFRRGKRGNVSESASRVTEEQAGAREMADRSVDDLLDEISTKETLTPGDRRRITAAKENLMKTDPEGFRSTEKYQVLDRLEKASRSDLGRGLALIPRTIRKTANADALTARWERKIGNVLDDPSRLSTEQFRQVQSANDAFTTARDRAATLEERFRNSGSEADFNAWEKAYKTARDADTTAKMTEVKVAQDVFKGEKGANVIKTLDALKKEADVNTMDATSAAMLSGTGTGFRNTFGTELMGVENRLFANTRAKITKSLFDENVGGFDRKGAKFGRKFGGGKWIDDIKRRANVGGNNPLEWAKNWSTTINSGGESSLQSQVYSRLAKYYKNEFDAQGLSGKQLDLRMRHAMLTDPEDMGSVYLDAAMKSSGLTGLFEKGQTIEKAVTDYVGRGTDSKLAQGASKIIMRMAVGFPTATGNFLYQSGKRLSLGLPSWIETGMRLSRGDKKGAAMAFDRGLKEAGSGAAMLGLGAALGSAGIISGSYPDDPEERARWEREGISENSIKIGGAWYPIPQGAGMLGLPIMVGAAIGAEGDSDESLKKLLSPKSLSKLLPTDQIQGFLNTLSGDESPQALKNIMASTVRAATPAGALLNQIAKSFDPTKNDTTQHGLFHNVLDQVISGIPGVNNMVDIADKTDDDGNPIQNPNPVQLAFGATSAAQGGGEERSKEIQDKINSALGDIDEYGLLDDPNLEGVLEGSGLEAYNKAKTGKKLDESDIKALKEGLVKGVSSEGTDTAYLERGEYDTNLAVLKMKRDLIKDDPTTKPSSLKDIDIAIKRGEIYKENQIPYDTISEYQSVGVDEWRKMGIPPTDDDYDPDVYDPEMYQKLWDIDQKLTKAGASYKKGSLDKQKYSVKEPGKGRGGRGRSGSGSFSADFGTLKDAIFSPRVQEYAGIDQKAGNVPYIRTVRPNIVHKISSS